MHHYDRRMKQYLRNVRTALPCSVNMKKIVISQLTANIKEFLLDHPDADLQTVQAHFGSPQEIAASCLEGQNSFVLLEQVSYRKKTITLVAGVMAVIVLMWFSLVVWRTYMSKVADKEHLTINIGEIGNIYEKGER